MYSISEYRTFKIQQQQRLKIKKHIIKNIHDYTNKYRLSNPLIRYNIQNTNPIWDMESENHKTSTIQ